MDKNTFGSSDEITVLYLIHDKLDNLEYNKKHSISKFLVNFNITVKNLNDVNDIKCRRHILSLIKNDYLIRLDVLLESKRFEPILISYLKNFIKTKIKIELKSYLANESKNR